MYDTKEIIIRLKKTLFAKTLQYASTHPPTHPLHSTNAVFVISQFKLDSSLFDIYFTFKATSFLFSGLREFFKKNVHWQVEKKRAKNHDQT